MEFKLFLNSFQLIILCLSVCYLNVIDAASSVTYLAPGAKTQIIPEVGKFGYNKEKLNIFCYKGGEKSLHNYLQSIVLNVEIESDAFTCFSGASPKEVQQAHEAHRSIFSFNWFSSSKKRIMNLNPFNKTCIGLETAEEFTITLNQVQVDPTKLILLAGGAILFFLSGSLSHNSLFFYLTGISVGNIASLIVLIWFISKLFPRKPFMYGIMATGWGLVAYLGRMLYDNVQPILMTYSHIVIAYILITSCISFAVCYYKGPPKKIRSKNLIKWGLQLAGLVSIFFSSEFMEASFGVMILAIMMYYFPIEIISRIRRVYRRRFPQKRKLLSKDEFEEQGRIETEKALNELREFLKSPKCKNQWSLVKNLSQPIRFASFVEGEDHVTMDETMEYDAELERDSESGNETDEMSNDSDDTIEESIAVNENFQRINKSKLPLPTPKTQSQNGNSTMSKSKLPLPKRILNGESSKYHQNFSMEKVSSSTPNAVNTSRPRRSNSIRSYTGYNFSDDEDEM